jgi:hypothetical protein
VHCRSRVGRTSRRRLELGSGGNEDLDPGPAVTVVQRGDRATVPPRETPQEILDRRLASGEIDPDAYTQARAVLAGKQRSP